MYRYIYLCESLYGIRKLGKSLSESLGKKLGKSLSESWGKKLKLKSTRPRTRNIKQIYRMPSHVGLMGETFQLLDDDDYQSSSWCDHYHQ